MTTPLSVQWRSIRVRAVVALVPVNWAMACVTAILLVLNTKVRTCNQTFLISERLPQWWHGGVVTWWRGGVVAWWRGGGGRWLCVHTH